MSDSKSYRLTGVACPFPNCGCTHVLEGKLKEGEEIIQGLLTCWNCGGRFRFECEYPVHGRHVRTWAPSPCDEHNYKAGVCQVCGFTREDLKEMSRGNTGEPILRRRRCETFQTDAVCTCGGTIRANGSVRPTSPPQYGHTCDSCHRDTWWKRKYPHIDHVPGEEEPEGLTF